MITCFMRLMLSVSWHLRSHHSSCRAGLPSAADQDQAARNRRDGDGRGRLHSRRQLGGHRHGAAQSRRLEQARRCHDAERRGVRSLEIPVSEDARNDLVVGVASHEPHLDVVDAGLFGGRIDGTFTDDLLSVQRAAAGLRRLFPSLRDVKLWHAWGGPIDISADHLPWVGRIGDRPIHYAHGYSGNGVAPLATVTRSHPSAG